MLTLKSDVEKIEAELLELVRMFDSGNLLKDIAIVFYYNKLADSIIITIDGKEYKFEKTVLPHINSHEIRKFFVRTCKIALYKALKSHFKHDLPWGALTGIRPTKMLYEMLGQGVLLKNAVKNLEDQYFVSPKKTRLVAEIVKNQNEQLLKKEDRKRFINLYVHIPFCPSRCNYCSFVSVPMVKQKQLVASYIKQLIEEIEVSKAIIQKNNQVLFSVYIGGGTPTSLNDSDFEAVLNAIGKNETKIEYTVEAGRPDTITKEKCDLMKRFGVTRVSVNPQSLHNKTLQNIGRLHTAQDFFTAYEIAKKHYFDINVDLIAGLQGEKQKDFLYTLDRILDLKPENLTIHTLCQKRGSEAIINNQNCRGDGLWLMPKVSDMIDDSISKLTQVDYRPYYLYRQKNALDNLENIGFSLPNKQCVNNITVMEEILSVIACGAGAISKRIFIKDNRIERLATPKDIKCYLERKEEVLKKKKIFFKK